MTRTFIILCVIAVATPCFGRTKSEALRKIASYCQTYNLHSGECWRWEPWISGGCAYRVYSLRTGELIRQDAQTLEPCLLLQQ
jgi:hypothetical protein